MQRTRPDLSRVDAQVREYIRTLEEELEALRDKLESRTGSITPEEGASEEILHEPSEAPTTMQVISATAHGIAKRTSRHLYDRQRRGGMGVFDIDLPEGDAPSILVVADESENLLLFTNLARAFRLPVSAIQQTPVRGRGTSILSKLNLMEGEGLAAILPDQAKGYVAMLSQRGNVRMLRHHIFGEYMKPGTNLYDYKAFGPLAAACWTPGDGDLFIATMQGKAIRFSEKLVPPQGGLGIRLSDGDTAMGIAPVYPDSGVFLLSADGKGSIRLMEGFPANKAPGAGGKIAIHTDRLLAACTINRSDDVFIISKLGKIIRFAGEQVPAKEGVVQGVICMSLRGDECSDATISQPASSL